MQGCITWINRPIVLFFSLFENKGLNSVTLKKNTKDTSNWSLRSSVTAGTNRWTFRRGPMHFCSLINQIVSARSHESSNVSFGVFSRLRKWYGKTSYAHLCHKGWSNNNNNNNKLYLHDHNKVLQYCKSYLKLVIDSL